MPHTDTDWTAERVWALPDDGNRYECVDGELLVNPAPTFRHNDAAVAFYNALRPYVTAHGLGRCGIAPADVVFGPRRLVEPDAMVVPFTDDHRPRGYRDVRRLLLAIEVLSPSSGRADRMVKRRLYQSEGVAEYWIVDVGARAVERWRPADARPELASAVLTWQPLAGVAPLTIDLPALFNSLEWTE